MLVDGLRRDVLAARRDDQVLLPAHDAVEALGVDVGKVSGPQPAVLRHVLPGGVLPVGVPHHDVPPPHHQLLVISHLVVIGLNIYSYQIFFSRYKIFFYFGKIFFCEVSSMIKVFFTHPV